MMRIFDALITEMESISKVTNLDASIAEMNLTAWCSFQSSDQLGHGQRAAQASYIYIWDSIRQEVWPAILVR